MRFHIVLIKLDTHQKLSFGALPIQRYRNRTPASDAWASATESSSVALRAASSAFGIDSAECAEALEVEQPVGIGQAGVSLRRRRIHAESLLEVVD